MSARTPLLLQVVSRLTPGRCGVSDQAVLLAGELRRVFGIETAYLVLNSSEPSGVLDPVSYCLPAQLLANALQLTGGRPGAILVHMSGYGYAPDGAPARVAEALAEVRASGKFDLAAYFHELYASGMPWRSAFWDARKQQRVMRQVASQCGLIVTSIGRHVAWLERQARTLALPPVQWLPVFSAAGEATNRRPVPQRDPALVVFGLAGTRRQAYRQLRTRMQMLDALGVEEILDVGSPCEIPERIGRIAVKPMGRLATEELGPLFAQSAFGYVPHPHYCLGKSSIFASYTAQGTIPVTAQPFTGEFDGLRDGVHLVSSRTAPEVRDSGLDACSQAAWNWYNAHRLRVHAELYARWMGHAADRADAAGTTEYAGSAG